MTLDHPSQGLPLDPRLLELLRCPACHAELEPPRSGELACRGCDRVYPVRDGVPILLVDEARSRA